MTDDVRPATPEMLEGPPVSGRRQLRVLSSTVAAAPEAARISPDSLTQPTGSSKRVKIVSIGCVENALTAARYRKLLALENWQPVDSTADADLVLVNTCGVSQERAEDSMRAIECLKRSMRAGARLVVTGCLVNIDPATLEGAELEGIEVVSAQDPAGLEGIVGGRHRLEDVRANDVPGHFLRPRLRALGFVARLARATDHAGLPYPPRVPRVLSAFEQPGWHFVQVSRGCAHACSYCAIRFAKGWITSEDRATVVEEVRRGVAAGHEHVVLVADDTGSYGVDKGTDIGELLLDLVALPGDFAIHVRNLEPMGMLRAFDRVKQAVATGKVRAITVPIQSGSNRILAAMGREYTLEAAMTALEELRRLAPEMSILTHVLVGFPGETLRDFSATLRLIRRFEFDGVAPDCFSPRPNTPALLLPGRVPWLARKLRYVTTIGYIVWRVYLRAGLSLRWRKA